MKKFIFYTFVAIIAYLALVHFTGFASDVGALGKTYAEGVKALQG